MMEINIRHENGVALVSVKGSVTSTNAKEFEVAVAEEPKEDGGIIIDAESLDYISSAGLRVILAAKKRCKNLPFKIINVNSEVKSVLDVTGFSEIMDVSTAVRQISVEGCDIIGAGACGECYRIDDETIIKLYYPKVSKQEIENEKALSKKAFVMGIPTAISYDIVESDGRTGVIYELINSKTLGELMRSEPENLEKYIDMYADVCRQVHSVKCDDGSLPTFKEINRADIKNVTGITEEEREYLHRFLDLVPEYPNCIHGDLNINNIMVQNGECCLIDMGEFSTGIPMFDISRILFSMQFAADEQEEYYAFYKMPTATVTYILKAFLKRYFGCETLEEAIKQNSDAEWLYPLAWFRCVTSMLKGERWPVKKREMALDLLRNKLIPFVKEKSVG